jgi:hypothetical protein
MNKKTQKIQRRLNTLNKMLVIHEDKLERVEQKAYKIGLYIGKFTSEYHQLLDELDDLRG